MKIWNRLFAAALACAMVMGGTACQDPVKQPVRERLELQGYEALGKDEAAFVNTPFYSDRDDEVTYAFNALWDTFGVASGGAVAKYGANSSWLYWDAAKWMWSADSAREGVKNVVKNYPQRADGFLWSWGDSETWGGAGYNNTDPTYRAVYHYDQMFNFINAVHDICLWEGNTSFLSEKDTTTAQLHFEVEGITYDYEDVSNGKTVLEKTEAAMEFILKELQGESGLVILGGENTGEFNSASSNYWDNLSFGYKDPYEGMLFLGALQSMADLYRMTGDSAKQGEYETLLNTARAAYDEAYWSEDKGRYVSDITASGKVLDYGLTFLNTEALYYGAGDQAKADAIFSWINGERIVEGDTAAGAEILDAWVIAPMSNTVPIESLKEMDEESRRNVTWWHAPSAINVFTNAKFKLHCENGGAIFYTTYFELMSRLRYGKTDEAMQRMIAIAREYGKDGLLRDPVNSYGSAWILGVIGEFPESGLVPGVFVKGFMGVNASADGLVISPNMPEEYEKLGAKGVYYAGKHFDIEINRGDSITLSATNDGSADFTLIFSDFAGKDSYVAEIGGKNVSAIRLEDGRFSVELSVSGRETITIR